MHTIQYKMVENIYPIGGCWR